MNQRLFYSLMILIILNLKLNSVGSVKMLNQDMIHEIRSLDSIESFYSDSDLEQNDLSKIYTDSQSLRQSHLSLDSKIKIKQEVKLIQKLNWIYKYFLDDCCEETFAFFVYLADQCSYYSNSLIDSKKIMIDKRFELKKIIPKKYLNDYSVMINFINQPKVSSCFFYLLGIINIILKEYANDIYCSNSKIIRQYFFKDRLWLFNCLPEALLVSIESFRESNLRLNLKKLVEENPNFYDL